ncbi:hypothetical protein ADU37_CDS20090 [Thermococcus sp. 2319x1]|nr:hypothetical protein ADU37_CDS20090 [Thermococcus sp. 2319x1]
MRTSACTGGGAFCRKGGLVRLIPALGRNYKVPEKFRVKTYHVAEKAGMVWLS